MRRKKRSKGKNSNYRKKGWWASIPLSQRVFGVLAGLLLIGAVVFVCLLLYSGKDQNEEPAASKGNPQTPISAPVEINPDEQNMYDAKPAETVKEMDISGFADVAYAPTATLEYGLEINRIGTYTGKYVEDGSNRDVTDVLAIIVTNTSDTFIEMVDFSLPGQDYTAYFRLTSLPAGQSALVMERNALQYVSEMQFDAPKIFDYTPTVNEFSLHTDVFSVNAADGVVNLINRSDRDISGGIAIYYKNVIDGIYLGGITYRFAIENGVKAGGVAQFMPNNYTVANSEILFIRYGS